MRSHAVRSFRCQPASALPAHIPNIIEFTAIGINSRTEVVDQSIPIEASLAKTATIPLTVDIHTHRRKDALTLLKDIAINATETLS